MMMKKILGAASFVLSLTGSAHAERILIDPNKAETLRCDDLGFQNLSYTLEGPEQTFVFTSADGQTHTLTFKNHEECRSKIIMVQKAQMDENHPWVQVDTTPLNFAFVEPPHSQEPPVRAISSESHHHESRR